MTGNQIAWGNLYETKFHNRRMEHFESEKVTQTKRANDIRIFEAKLDAATKIETANISARTSKLVAAMNAAANIQIANMNNAARIKIQQLSNEMQKYTTDVNASLKEKDLELQRYLGELNDIREKMKIANDAERVQLEKEKVKIEKKAKYVANKCLKDSTDAEIALKATQSLLNQANTKKSQAEKQKIYTERRLIKQQRKESKARTNYYNQSAKESKAETQYKKKLAEGVLSVDDQYAFEKYEGQLEAASQMRQYYQGIATSTIGALTGMGGSYMSSQASQNSAKTSAQGRVDSAKINAQAQKDRSRKEKSK